MLGVPLPLCSCGVLPTAISLKRNGASTSATTSFLIATPQTGIDSIAATYSLLGLGFAIVRPVAAFASAIVGGTIMGKLAKDINEPSANSNSSSQQLPPTLGGKIKAMLRYGVIDMVGSVGKWLVIGLIIAALITALVPDDFFVTFAAYPLFAMIAVIVIAIPMYVCATGSIPIALSLILKGLTPGTAFVFLMAGPAVNFASYTLLSRTMGRRNTLIYIAIIALSAIALGLGIDYLLPASWFMPRMMYGDACCMHQSGRFDTLCSIILSILLIYSLIIKRITPKQPQSKMAKEYQIDGMMCVHCKARVEEGLAQVDSVTSVSVDLSKKIATVEGAPSDDAIKAKVLSLGYTYIGSR
jgi:uncharacterized membrane protein YraQ (UPF0718 family)/copper chaperone CopZ